jgi:hypothetical protein
MTRIINSNSRSTRILPEIGSRSSVSVKEARKILGTTAKGLSDEAIERLVSQVDVLTGIVVAHFNDSKNQSSIDISGNRLHTDD